MRKTGANYFSTYNMFSNLKEEYRKEFLILNGRLKEINIEKNEFIRKADSFMLNPLRKSSFIKNKKLISTYNLKLFEDEVEKNNDLKREYNNSLVKKGYIDLYTIIQIYDIIEERYYSAICLVKFANDYVISNHKYNGLINNSDDSNYELRAQRNLFLYPEDSVYLISNKQVSNDCLLLIDNYYSTKETCARLRHEIESLEAKVKNYMDNRDKQYSDINILKEYRNILSNFNVETEKIKKITK